MMDAAAQMCAVCCCRLDSILHLVRCQPIAPMFCATQGIQDFLAASQSWQEMNPGVPLPDSGSTGPVPTSQATIRHVDCHGWHGVPIAEYRRVEAERDEGVIVAKKLMEAIKLSQQTIAQGLCREAASLARENAQEHLIAELRAQLAAASPPASVVATIGAPPCVAKSAGPLGTGHTSDPPPMPFNAICYSR